MKRANKRIDIPVRTEHAPALAPEQRAVVVQVVAEHAALEGPLLPILHALQDRMGWISPGVIAAIAQELNLSRAEVHGVVSFYHWFRRSEPGERIIHVCRAEACQAVGAGRLLDHARRKLGIDLHATTPDRRFSLEAVYCLGNCANGPSVMIGEDVYGAVDAQRFDQLVEEPR